jgi:hypothetical protein
MSVRGNMIGQYGKLLNVREYRRGNQKRTIQKNWQLYRTLLLFGFGMIAIFGSSEIELSGAGPLGCLTTATVAGYKWRQRRKQGEQVSIIYDSKTK